MNINIYTTYNVKYTCRGCVIDVENSELNDICFKDFNYSNTNTMNGYYLIENIAFKIKDQDFHELVIKDNEIIVEHFNPNNGESCTYTWIIEEVKE